MCAAPTACAPTIGQQAAIARVAYALETPAAVALVCGPPGVGKTLVLVRIAEATALRGRRCVRRSLRTGLADVTSVPPQGDAVLIVDDGHEATAGELADVLEAWRRREPRGGVVLAGEGRLLTLVAQDVRIERAVVLRATLGPFTRAESRELVLSRGVSPGEVDDHDTVVRAIHEIAGGIPARILQLADLVRMVAKAAPAGRITADDVEALHRRLSLQAA